MPDDFIDNLMQRWLTQRPELDVSPIAVIGRAIRIADVLKRELKELLRPYGLEVWEFDVLATLRWGGNEDGLTPKELIDVVMVSSGTMTHRLDRLENAGFVTRVPNPNDRRSVRIQLAKRGIEVVEKSLTKHIASAEQAVSELSQREQQQTARVLKKILAKIDHPKS
jgi:DNA-binding MarR family transcriptional regulator